MRGNGTLVKVAIFTVAMLLVAAMLVVVFGSSGSPRATPITPRSRRRHG